MFAKKVFINIFCPNLPCHLTILSCDNKIITQTFLQTNESQISIYATGNHIKLIANYQNSTIFQTIYLTNRICQVVNTSFGFCRIINPSRIFIFLTDENYGFPIANATLRLKKTDLRISHASLLIE